MYRYFRTWMCFAAFAVPLKQKGAWQTLEFRKIPAHVVTFDERGLTIEVRRSSSPVIFPLPAPVKVSSLKVVGDFEGQLKIDGEQGQKGSDDFVLRLGLVVSGEKTLGFFQRKIAAPWVKTLFGLAPEGQGVDRIQFLAAVRDRRGLGKERVHPLSNLMHERNEWLQNEPGPFFWTSRLKQPVETLALWISTDGDDTQSEFRLRIRELVLNPES